MKKLTLFLLTAFLSCTFFSMHLNAETKALTLPKVASITVESAEAHILLARLDKINAIDKSTLHFTEKRQLRMEARSIKGQIHELGGGRFLTIGAVGSFLLLTLLLL